VERNTSTMAEQNTPEVLATIEQQIAADVAKDCRAFLKRMQKEWKVDCIDISKYALAKWRKELTPEIDKDEFIEKADIKVNVEVQILNTGESE